MRSPGTKLKIQRITIFLLDIMYDVPTIFVWAQLVGTTYMSSAENNIGYCQFAIY